MMKSAAALGAWLVQRVSAIYMLCFIVFVLFQSAFDAPRPYAAWHDWIMRPGMRVALAAFFAALLAHAWVGLRDVIMDYVHGITIRVVLLGLISVSLAAAGIWIVQILWARQA